MGLCDFRGALAVGLWLVACEPTDISAVGAPGGPFRTGAGCGIADLEAGGAQSCPSLAQHPFERLTDDVGFELRTSNLSRRQVSCRRSYCGTGSLSVHADYRWRQGTVREAAGNTYLGEIRYRLPEPVELYNKTLTYTLFVDGPVTPVNSYIAVLDTTGRFRMIDDGVVFTFGRWTQRGGAVRPENVDLGLPPGTTSLVATEVIISVYLATDVRTGDRDHWSGDLFVDDLGWN